MSSQGSGWLVALTAMKCGKNAIQAVEIAVDTMTNSGGDVDWIHITTIKGGKI